MASLEGLKKKLDEYRPQVQSAFMVYVTPRPSPVEEIDEQFEMVMLTSPTDPLLPKICATKRQLKVAEKAIGAGRWRVLIALKDGEPVGRIWETHGSERGLFDGIPRVHLNDDESFMFDLFVTREYRRSGVAATMADYFFKLYPVGGKEQFIYGFISYENAPSILWHHSVGFQIAQTMNYLAIGPHIKWKLPFSEMPRFGPMSKKGRHTDSSKDMFGPPLFP